MTDDFFRARIDQMIDLGHPLAVLAQRLPWSRLEAARHALVKSAKALGIELKQTFQREGPWASTARACFATEVADPKKPGRIKRIYRPQDAMTPLNKLASLSDAASYLHPGVTLEGLQQLTELLARCERIRAHGKKG